MDIVNRIWEAMGRYADEFGETFPVYGVAYESEEELLSIIQKAIKDGKPVKPVYDGIPNIIY